MEEAEAMELEYIIETWNPTHTSRQVSVEELEGFYEHIRGSESADITWNNGGDDVLIVSVGEDTATVSLLHDATWYWLEVSPETELVEIELCGQEAFVPQGAMVPRHLGLEILLGAHEFPRLLTEYAWREQ
jgi:hypothetical protein